MKNFKTTVLLASLTVAFTANANFEYPEGSGVYYDIDNDKAFVQWVDVNKVANDVTIASEVEYDGTKYPVTYFGEYGKFYGSHNMTSVTVPASICEIPGYWFQDCTSLVSAIINSKTIGENAFRGDQKLAYVNLNEGVEVLGSAAFCELPSLETITIPSTVTQIDSWQFYNDTKLKEITFKGSVPAIGSDFLTGVMTVTKITVPNGQKEAYIPVLEEAGVTNAREIVEEATPTSIVNAIMDLSADDENYYNIMGQPVAPDTKGILIHKSKKYINK